VQAFFDALKDESSADSVWFRGVNNNMTRMIALRKAANCETFDHSAEEIYMEHIKAISAALLDGGRQQSGGGKAAGRACLHRLLRLPDARHGLGGLGRHLILPQEFLSPKSPMGATISSWDISEGFPRISNSTPGFRFRLPSGPRNPPRNCKGWGKFTGSYTEAVGRSSLGRRRILVHHVGACRR
jgi:hypothetical protein